MRTPQEVISKIKPYGAGTYEHLDLNRLALFGIAMLQELAVTATLENVSVLLFRLFPSRFSLEGYDCPDSNRVNRALLQLRPKYRDWVDGDPNRGFDLTPVGQRVLRETRVLLNSPTGGLPAPERGSRPRTGVTPSGEIELIRCSELFTRWRRDPSTRVELRLVYDMLQVLPYTPKPIVARRRRTLARAASEAQDAEVSRLLAWVREAYPAAFDGKEEKNDD